ncbi:MAG: hypothetical protein K2L45_00965, partial [Muribaculaceae bacterium]|nr:hypothetical protein [Muribaculaceae bacterium]
MDILEHESDQLINNLGLEQIVGLQEIAQFRSVLAEKIGKLEITEQEREMMRRVNSIQRDNLKWKALSGALNNTMMITGGGNNAYQLGFQVLVTAARTGIEYKTAQNEQTIEELRAMWDLRKKDLNDFIELRKSALNILFKLYQKYNLKESDRLTEQTSMLFNKIISNPDPKTMVRQLGDHQDKFGHIADFYYYLGMGNLDCGNIKKAEECFDKYITLYNKAPLFRTNEKAGMIALARLGYNLCKNNDDIEKNISIVLKNLPNNSMAMIQCALISDKILNNPSKALSILRKALDNDSSDDKTAIILTASLLLHRVKNTSSVYQDFIAAYSNQPRFDIDAAINMWIAKKENVFSKLSRIFTIEDLAESHWIADYEINEKFKILFPSKYTVNLDRIKMWVEKHDADQVTITPYTLTEKNALTLEKIEKISDFKNNPDLKYLFMDALDKDHFIVKRNIDYNSILTLTFPRIAEFSISDPKKIVKFLKENSPDNRLNEIIATSSKNDIVEKIKKATTTFIGNLRIDVEIYHVLTQSGNSYVKFQLDDPREIQICYKFDAKKGKLIPAYIKSQGKFTFASTSMMKEFGFSSTTKKTTSSTSGKQTHSQKNHSNSTTGNEAKDEKPWWKIWG